MSLEASPTNALSMLLAAVRKLMRRPLSRLTSLIRSSGSRNCCDAEHQLVSLFELPKS